MKLAIGIVVMLCSTMELCNQLNKLILASNSNILVYFRYLVALIGDQGF